MESRIRGLFDVIWFPISVVFTLLPINTIVKFVLVMSNFPNIVLNSRAFEGKGFNWNFMRRWWNNFGQPVWVAFMGGMGVISLIFNSENWLWILTIYLCLLPFFVAGLSIWLYASIIEASKERL